jgi:arylsulfatase A-like enzyme
MTRRGSALAAALLCVTCGSGPGAPDLPSVLLVSIDTLRADRLGCYGYGRDTTPALDELARVRAVRFAHAVAEAPWTLPSHVTMLSGFHPLTHGVRRPTDAPSLEVELLAQRLAPTHYGFALTDGGWISEEWGFERGFASFHAAERDVAEAVERVLEYVRHRHDKGPWFGFLHTYDVHCPYDPPPPWRGSFTSAESEPLAVEGRCGNPHFNAMALTPGQARYLSDRYDEDVRRVDDALRKLFAGLDRLGLWEQTVVIVTSDHGEEFLERGQIGHERTLSREVLSIPLLVAAPGVGPRVVEGVVGLADLVPTVLELVGRGPAGRLDGRSLVPLMRGETDGTRRNWVLSELGWQVERLARTTSTEHEELEPIGLVEDRHGLLRLRADMLASGYRPRTVDPARRAEELSALGY